MADDFGQLGKGIKKLVEKAQGILKNPELDKAKSGLRDEVEKSKQEKGKAEREKLKEKPGNGNIAARLLAALIRGVRKDAYETEELSQDQQTEVENYCKKEFDLVTEGLKGKAIAECFEGKKLDNFVDHIAKYPVLEAAITECKKKDSKRPIKRIVQFIRSNSTIFAGLGTSIMGWLGADKEEEKKGGKPSNLNKVAAKADAILKKGGGKKKGKKDAGKKTATKSEEDGGRKGSSGGNKVRAKISGKKIAIRSTGTKASGKPGKRTRNIEIRGKSPSYKLADKYKVKAKSFPEFQKTLLSIPNRNHRTAYINFQINAGFIPPGYKKLHTITVKGKNEDGSEAILTFDTTGSGVRVGEDGVDENGNPKSMEVSLDGPGSQLAMKQLGLEVILPGMEKAIYKKAMANKGNIDLHPGEKLKDEDKAPGDFGAHMLGAEALITANRLRQEDMKRKGLTYDDLIAGHFKSVVKPTTSKRIIDIRGGVIDKKIVQRKTVFHKDPNASYNDATQGTRGFDPNSITIDGQKVAYKDFVNNPELLKRFGFNEKPVGDYNVPEDLENAAKKTS